MKIGCAICLILAQSMLICGCGEKNEEKTDGRASVEAAPTSSVPNDVSFGWRDGAIIWTIPLGWNEHGTSGETEPVKTNAMPEQQRFVITLNGTLTVIKAGCFVSRGTNTQVRSGEVLQ